MVDISLVYSKPGYVITRIQEYNNILKSEFDNLTSKFVLKLERKELLSTEVDTLYNLPGQSFLS